MATYQVTIQLDQATLTTLSNGDYQLCCLLAAEVGDAAALPLLWSATSQYGLTTKVSWPAPGDVFTSWSPLALGKGVDANWTTPMSLGQLLTVAASGSGQVSNNGVAGAFAVYNPSSRGMVCGLQTAGQPLCALPLPGGQGGQVFNSLPKIMLLFANGKVPALGTAIDQWPGGRTAALLVDANQGNNPTVSFNSNTGWDWNQQAWGTSVPFTGGLKSYLISSPAALQQQSSSLRQQLELPTG